MPQKIRVVSSVAGWQKLFYDYKLDDLWLSHYAVGDGSASYDLPLERWIGIFHYDYATGAFTRGQYSRRGYD